MDMDAPILSVKNLKVSFSSPRGLVKALRGISFEVKKRDAIGIIGETGSGKSVTGLSIIGLLPKSITHINGEIVLNGHSLLKLNEKSMRDIRGNIISMIFQEPMTSLNPVLTIGFQIGEVLKLHQSIKKQDINDKIIEILHLVRMPDPQRIIKRYPHELSGGMRQRVMIAIAMICKPKLLIADEPTTALDVTIQAQVLQLIRELINSLGCSVIFISHDIGVIKQICKRVLVMYSGTVVEESNTKEILTKPFHPYSKALLDSIPRLRETMSEFRGIHGNVPDMTIETNGCVFSDRCQYMKEYCLTNYPYKKEKTPDHYVACHYPLNS